MTAYRGGYHLIRSPLIRSGAHKHTLEGAGSISPETLHALNVVQATPWRVNGWMLGVVRQLVAEGSTLGGLPPPDDLPLPPRLDDDQWSLLDRAAQNAHKGKLEDAHSRNAGFQSKRLSVARKIAAATALEDVGTIYMPHCLDFRTRLYPMPQDLNPQGDDLARSLLEFGNGIPLGADGLFWLSLKLANCAGQDKLALPERRAWVMEHHDLIMDSGLDPLDGRRFWAEFEDDEPLGFLAAAREYALAHEMGDPTMFISRQPIPLDGSCNGLQHLSLLGRDSVGAKKTNCSAEEGRYDLYAEVADVVAAAVSEDAVAGNAEAQAWAGNVTRKVVKRAVMTTPYGVTQIGIKDQIVADGHTEGLDGNPNKLAMYLMKQIVAAMEHTVRSASEIMGYFQQVASVLGERDVPLAWTTPAGSRIVQRYGNQTGRQVRTILGKINLMDVGDHLPMDRKKQTLASAPNIIHSLDAAMLQLTVLAAVEYGITDFAMIHDSYGTHAANTGELYLILRNQAADMYTDDWLSAFHNDVQSYAPAGVKLPELPEFGDFDVNQVRDAPYFFS